MPLQCADHDTWIRAVATGLPNGLVESLTSFAERILPFANGDFQPSPSPTLLDKLTDQLLVVISDAVAAVAAAASPPLSGVATQRLFAWVAADARGAATPLDKVLAATVGKRLEKQAQKVRETLTSASARAAEARKAAREAAVQDTTLVAALPAELALIDEAEHKAYASARNEIYVGFHELGSGSTAASGSLSVSVEAPPQLPEWVSREPEDGPRKDELLKRALDRILTQEITIDQLRETNEWQESYMRRERLRMQQRAWEDERIQRTLHNELWDTECELKDAHDKLEEMRDEIEELVEERVKDRCADLEYDLERSRTGNSVLRTRLAALEAELSLHKGD